MIGALQWLVSLGRYEIAPAVMTMSGFRVAPRQGHLDRVKRIYGYVSKMRYGAIRFRVSEPDLTDLPIPHYEWDHSVYGDIEEDIPSNIPKTLGKTVYHMTYVDANLHHDFLTGRAVTGILHFLNKTPIDAYSKKQATVETATYGSKFVAARIATDQIIDLRLTLRYFGVEVGGSTTMFGDNESVVKSSINPDSPLRKPHNALAYHRVREAIAAKFVTFHHISGIINPADMLSKHWGYSQIWPALQALLFYQGATAEIDLTKDTESKKQVSEEVGKKGSDKME